MQIDYRLPKKVSRRVEDKKGELVVKEIDNPLEGVIMWMLPSYPERLKITKKIVELSGGDDANLSGNVDAAEYSYHELSKRVKSVDVKRKDNGYHFKTLDELGFDEDGSKTIEEMSRMLMQGVRLGK